jgi:PTH1 family peptidyl-tRNA hydrolase
MYKLIVGLGNPGKEYAQTRHNVGFLAIEEYAKKNDFPAFKNKEKFRGDISEQGSGEQKQIIIMPDTFMNLSGQSVLLLSEFYKIVPEEILIIHDELDFEFGRVEMKVGGEGKSSHRGIRSISESLRSNDFHRLRIGIGGKDLDVFDASDYVLAKWNKEETEKLPKLIRQVIKQIV